MNERAKASESGTHGSVTVTSIRHWSSADVTHVAVDLNGQVKYKFGHLVDPERLFFDLQNVHVASDVLNMRFDQADGFLSNVRVGEVDGGARIALDLNQPVDYTVNLVPNPYRLEIAFRHKADQNGKRKHHAEVPPIVSSTIDPPKVVNSGHSPGVEVAEGSRPQPGDAEAALEDIHEARPDGRGERSLIRALGLKIGKIVIDPGHGGDDHGTMSANGVLEKDIVLDVALRLGRLLHNLGLEVIYTRAMDRYLPLEARTAIANREGADLFLSIHANSSPDHDARGIETYYLNFTNSPEALEVAARENVVSRRPVSELRDLVQKIAQQNRVDESREFAANVQKALAQGLPGERNRGIREAPFIVLTGAAMPAALAEISFISNSEDENHLEDPKYRQKIAQALYRGIAAYINGLSGVAPRLQSAASIAPAARPAAGPSGNTASTSAAALSTAAAPSPDHVPAAVPVAAVGVADNPELALASGDWSDSLLDFIAANRPFIVIFLLLAAAWSFFLTAPAPGQAVPALADAASGASHDGRTSEDRS